MSENNGEKLNLELMVAQDKLGLITKEFENEKTHIKEEYIAEQDSNKKDH